MTNLDYVHEISLGSVKAFVIEAEKTILLDTGIAPVHPEILAFFEKNGIQLGNEQQKEHLRRGSLHYIMNFLKDRGTSIDTIICTHYHADHTGCLKDLKDTLKVPVAMHPLDIPFVEGTKEPPPSTMLPPRLAKYFKPKPCNVEIALEDNQMFTPSLQVIHVEGHTPGNLCLLFNQEILLVGDTLMGKNALNPAVAPCEINPPMPNASHDQEKALANLKKLLNYKFEAILPSHGESVMTHAKEKLQKFIEATAID